MTKCHTIPLRLAKLFAVLLGLQANGATADPHITAAELRSMTAASPARELGRAWAKCIDEARALALLNQVADPARIETFAYKSCEEWESRLTGELVKRHGLSKADAAIAAIKRSFRAGFEATARQVNARPADYFQQVGDWVIYKDGSGRCSAKNRDSALMEPHMSWIKQSGDSWSLVFATGASYSRQYSDRAGEIEPIELALIGSRLSTTRIRTVVRYELGSDYIGFAVALDEPLVAALAHADHVQFQALSDERTIARVFPISGIEQALRAVQLCASGRSERG